MTIVLAICVGLALGGVLIAVARRREPDRALRLYAIGLLVTALLYLTFALVGRANASWLALEALSVVLYGAAAWIGYRRWPVVLAVGWAGHVAWDVLLHMSGPGAAYTPPYYVWFCVGFDLIVAAAILAVRTPDTVTAP
jgi:hypothetical protein